MTTASGIHPELRGQADTGGALVALLRRAVVVALCSQMVGCTFLYCSGGGPLRREELGDWVGLAARPAPESEELASLVKGLKLLDNSFLGSHHSYLEGPSIRTLHYGSYREVPFTPARHLMVKGEFNPWLRLLPGVRRGDWLYYNSAREDYRTFYAREREWGGGLLVTERLLAGSHSEAYDLTTRRRVAAQASLCVLAEVLVFHVR
ncbi:MAG: hypothetical protein ACLF0G_02480, partial [Candidatus Brocadiia bacterium]